MLTAIGQEGRVDCFGCGDHEVAVAIHAPVCGWPPAPIRSVGFRILGLLPFGSSWTGWCYFATIINHRLARSSVKERRVHLKCSCVMQFPGHFPSNQVVRRKSGRRIIKRMMAESLRRKCRQLPAERHKASMKGVR